VVEIEIIDWPRKEKVTGELSVKTMRKQQQKCVRHSKILVKISDVINKKVPKKSCVF